MALKKCYQGSLNKVREVVHREEGFDMSPLRGRASGGGGGGGKSSV